MTGPTFAVLLTQFLPLDEPYAFGLLIFSLAPTAPALPLFIRLAGAEMACAAANIPLEVVGTVELKFLSVGHSFDCQHIPLA